MKKKKMPTRPVLGVSEKRGIFFLLLVWLILFSFKKIPSPIKINSTHNTRNNVKKNKTYFYSEYSENNQNQEKAPPKAQFPFNPNSADSVTLSKLGLPTKTIRAWLKARAHGFIIRRASDWQRFSLLSSKDYHRLASYIVIDSTKIQKQNRMWKAPERAVLVVDLNSCDSLELTGIPGIGPTLSHRVIQYRDKLGGFISKNQLLEVYGIDSSILMKMEPYFTISENNIQKMDINTLDINELKHHPYINFRESNILMNYRKTHGPFKNVDDLKKVKGVRPDLVEKLTPYLSFSL